MAEFTCGRQSGMQGKIIISAILVFGLIPALACRASTNNFLSEPAAPGSSLSALYSLESIYRKLDLPYTNVVKRPFAFVEPQAMPTNGTMATTDEIMAVLTNRAPVTKTGQTTSYFDGDDGSLQNGVAWPSPRFVTNKVAGAEIVIRDNLTGLMWTKNANLPAGTRSWSDAVTYCENLTYCGYSDWRLPNIMEAISLMNYGRMMPTLEGGGPTFINVQTGDVYYWASSVDAGTPSTYAWRFSMRVGTTDTQTKATLHYVWPVRSGP